MLFQLVKFMIPSKSIQLKKIKINLLDLCHFNRKQFFNLFATLLFLECKKNRNGKKLNYFAIWVAKFLVEKLEWFPVLNENVCRINYGDYEMISEDVACKEVSEKTVFCMKLILYQLYLIAMLNNLSSSRSNSPSANRNRI